MNDKEHKIYIKACRALGLGDITLHHRKLSAEPLNEDEWDEVRRLTLAYQFHLSLIVAKARTRSN